MCSLWKLFGYNMVISHKHVDTCRQQGRRGGETGLAEAKNPNNRSRHLCRYQHRFKSP